MSSLQAEGRGSLIPETAFPPDKESRMKRLVVTTLASFLGLGCLAAESVKFAIGEWEPYTGQKMEAYGMVSEVVAAACAAGGLVAAFEFFPWKRAEAGVEGGTYFATFPYQETLERDPVYYFSEFLCRSSNGILLHKSNAKTAHFTYSSPDDLNGFNIGTLAGSDAINLPLRHSRASVEEVQTVEQNLKKLEAYRLDAVIDDRPVLFLATKKYCGTDAEKLSQFYFSEKGFGSTTEYKLMVSRKYPNSRELLVKFNTGLKLIKASGEYQKILKKYGL
jgi:polar amino acid transport system substrate-binding protein